MIPGTYRLPPRVFDGVERQLIVLEVGELIVVKISDRQLNTLDVGEAGKVLSVKIGEAWEPNSKEAGEVGVLNALDVIEDGELNALEVGEVGEIRKLKTSKLVMAGGWTSSKSAKMVLWRWSPSRI
jgi:hypothetical protein